MSGVKVKLHIKRGSRVVYTDTVEVDVPEFTGLEEAYILAARALQGKFDLKANEWLHIVKIG